MRALSPGINDPRTAVRVLDRLGAALCTIVSKPLATGLLQRNGQIVFQRNVTTYDGLTDAMFDTIRQSGGGSISVLTHMADILTKVAQCETQVERLEAIRRHGNLILADELRTIENSDDKRVLVRRLSVLSETLGSRCLPSGVGAH